MPLPKLSPLQSRLAASLVALVLVLMLYLGLSSSHFAYASTVDSISPEDHNHERLLPPYILEGEIDEAGIREVEYEADFLGADRSIIGRAPTGVSAIENNNFALINVEQGATVHYMFQNSSLWGPTSSQQSGLPSPVRLKQRSDEEVQRRFGDILGTKIESEAEDVLRDGDDSEGFKIRPRQLGSRLLYVTINTCLQPYDPNDPTGAKGPPPQLELYISQSAQNPTPGPSQPSSTQQKVVAVGGFANITVEATGDVFIGVSAPNTTNYVNVYSVEIAASIDAPFHSYNASQPDLYLVDSDTSSALLVTNNLTTLADGPIYDAWMSLPPPFVIFAANQNNTLFSGVQNSYCGLERYAQIAGTTGGERTSQVQTRMTNVTSGSLPKQQFYFQGLNGSSSYFGTLAMTGNSTAAGNGVVGGGGQVWKTMSFQTQSDGNCAVIFNLSFCNSVSYAVPGNPQKFPNVTALAEFYDSGAQTAYTNFDYAMQQIPCEIDSSGKYSLARTCDDCRVAYKNWLCSVMIPRCMDFSSTAPWLQERNIVQQFPNSTKLDPAQINGGQDILYLNSSRNPSIDETVQPGPYKEILPCDDLCYNIVQSCPSAMGFGCPLPGQLGFDHSYGVRRDGSAGQEGQITCNYPGAVYNLNGASVLGVPFLWSAVGAVVLGLLLF